MLDFKDKLKGLIGFMEKRPLSSSLLINGLLFLLTIAFFEPYFRTNDDVGMMMRASGMAFVSEPSSHLIFSNIILGWLLSALYSWTTEIPWYGIYQISLLFISHVVILYLIIKSKAKVKGLLAFLLYFLLLGTDIILGIQFTITASLLTSAGIFLLISDKERKRNFSTTLIISIALTSLGAMVRWESFLLIFALSIPIMVFHLIETKVEHRKIQLKGIGFVLVASTILQIVHQQAYNLDQEWSEYLAFNKVRGNIIDYEPFGNISQEEQIEILNSMGWSFNDYNTMVFWFYLDDKIYNYNTLSNFLSMIPQQSKAITWDNNMDRLESIFSYDFSSKFLYLFLFLLPFIRASRNRILMIASTSILGIIILEFLMFEFKMPPPRVFIPMMTVVIFAVLLSIDPMKKLKYLALISVPLIVLNLQKITNEFQFCNQMNAKYKWLVNDVKNFDSSSLYISWGDSYPFHYIGPLSKINFLENVSLFGLGVGQKAPDSQALLTKHGVDDLYRELYERKDRFLIISRPRHYMLDKYLKFVEEHYEKRIVPRVVHKNEIFVVYQFDVNQKAAAFHAVISSDCDAFINQSFEFHRLKKYKQSISACEKALDCNPKDYRAYNNIGMALMYLDQPESAANSFQKALVLNPDFQLAKNNLNWALDVAQKNKK